MRLPLTGLAAISLGLAVGCTSPSGGPGTPLPRLSFSELDANGDGAIDPEEFRKLSDALFARLDADGDGKISEAEYKQAAEQQRPPHRPHHGSGGRSGGSGGWPGGGGGGGWPGGGGGPY
jgi:EF hand domain-containing protein